MPSPALRVDQSLVIHIVRASNRIDYELYVFLREYFCCSNYWIFLYMQRTSSQVALLLPLTTTRTIISVSQAVETLWSLYSLLMMVQWIWQMVVAMTTDMTNFYLEEISTISVPLDTVGWTLKSVPVDSLKTVKIISPKSTCELSHRTNLSMQGKVL